MYYSIYSKLRAIYSFLPKQKDIEILLSVQSTLGFVNNLTKMNLLQRFPVMNKDLESHLKMIPFSLAKFVRGQIPGTSALFFDAYLRNYELQDIKNIINGGQGFFVEGLRDKKFNIQELDDYMQNRFWKDCWHTAYSKYKGNRRKVDIEISLDHCYYSSFLKDTDYLPFEEKYQTMELILILINFKNRLSLYRLKNIYNLESFEAKKFLIPEGEVFENYKEQEGLLENTFIKEFTHICYKDFKFKMYSMRAILAFFFLLTIKINEILSIYRAKISGFDRERLKEIWGGVYVGS
jgi:vacuolar-type H+-ATPase subunit C/Vma6